MEKVFQLVGKAGIGELLEANPSAPIFFFTSNGTAFLRAQEAREGARGLVDINITPITRGSMESFVADDKPEDGSAFVDLGNLGDDDEEVDSDEGAAEDGDGAKIDDNTSEEPAKEPAANSNAEASKPDGKSSKSTKNANQK